MSALPLSASFSETAIFRQSEINVPDRDGWAAAEAGSLSLEMVTTRAQFAELEEAWNDLFVRAGRSTQLFQTFGWLWHWVRHFLPEGPDARTSLAIVAGRRNGRLVIVCPFVLSREHGLNRLSFMGDPVSQYGDILVEPGPYCEADIRAAWTHVLHNARVELVGLRKVRSDAAIMPLLRNLGAIATDPQVAPYIAFDGETDYAKFETRYSSSSRRNRRRQLRRLEERGQTAFVRLPAGPEAQAAVSEAIGLKRLWLKEKGLVSSAIADPRTEAFFRDCAGSQDRTARVEVALVRTAGSTAALEITLTCKDRIAIHVIAYDMAFEKMGAGGLLMEDSIRRACQSGKGTFDLLAPGGTYKFDWADKSVDVADYALGLSMKGRIYAAWVLKRFRPAAKAAVERLPMTLRRHLSAMLSTVLVLAA